MFTHTPRATKRSWQGTTTASASSSSQPENNNDDGGGFTALHFAYASNLSPATMHGRYPSSLFCGLARLRGWRWIIVGKGEGKGEEEEEEDDDDGEVWGRGNIVRSETEGNGTGGGQGKPEGDVVYGALYFITGRDEAALDEGENVPVHAQKHYLQVERLDQNGESTGQVVEALVYLDEGATVEGEEMREDYVVWMRKAVRDARKVGLPAWYAEGVIGRWLPVLKEGEDEGDMAPVRVTFGRGMFQD